MCECVYAYDRMEHELIDFICAALNIHEHDLKEGLIIQRDMLLDPVKYEKLKPHIVSLKKIFSSKTMTSMHASAELTQKWPYLNLVRQVLKRMGYDIKPERKCAGRDETGKKRFDRFFVIHKRENNITKNQHEEDAEKTLDE
jgi:hypothetical protein